MSLRSPRAVNRLERQPPLPPPPADAKPPPPPAPPTAAVPPSPPPPGPKPKPKPAQSKGPLSLTIPVRGVKVCTPIAPESLDMTLLHPEGQPQPDIELQLRFASAPNLVFATARIGGKGYRRCCKAVQAGGASGGFVILQGVLSSDGDSLTLTGAGLSFQPRLPKPEPEATP